jgi:hypothetical protein
MRGGVCAYGGIAVYLSRNGGGYILVNLVENVSGLHGVCLRLRARRRVGGLWGLMGYRSNPELFRRVGAFNVAVLVFD